MDYTSLQNCKYGDSVAFSLTTYRADEEPIVKEGMGRIGTRIRFEGTGELTADDPGSLLTAITSLRTNCSVQGQNLLVTGLASAGEYQLLAAQCLNGGPQVGLIITDGNVPLQKLVTIRALAEMPSVSTPLNSYRMTVAVRPDGLRTITWTGTVQPGIGSPVNVTDYFLNTVLPTFRGFYPLPTWKVEFKYELASSQFQLTSVNYTLTATEFFGELPEIGTDAFAVDGSASYHSDRDEQQRLTTTYDFDLLIVGDLVGMTSFLRSNITGDGSTVIFRESVQAETLKENRLRASFTVLDSADTTPLMQWTETARLTIPADEWEEATFIGADPILVKKPRRLGRVTQSGSATGAMKYKRPPDAQWPNYQTLPSLTLSDKNVIEKETQWDYESFLVDENGVALADTDVEALSPSNLSRDVDGSGAFYS